MQIEALSNENQQLKEQLENALGKVEMVWCIVIVKCLLLAISWP